jgi:hypothetical protein
MSRATLEPRLRQQYSGEGHARAKVLCERDGSSYRCTAQLNGHDGADGTVSTTYTLSGHQKGDATKAIP